MIRKLLLSVTKRLLNDPKLSKIISNMEGFSNESLIYMVPYDSWKVNHDSNGPLDFQMVKDDSQRVQDDSQSILVDYWFQMAKQMFPDNPQLVP